MTRSPAHPITGSPDRIVSLQPSATLTLQALGALDRVVACTRYCADVCPGVASGNRIIVHDSWTAQAEQILAAKPDLVIASVPYQEKAVIEILKAGVRFLGLAPRWLEDIYADIALIASVVGAPDRGRQVIAEMAEEVGATAERTSSLPHPRVWCEEWGKPLIASQPWVAQLVEAAGGIFLAEPGRQTQADVVGELQPDVIVVAWCGAGDRVPLEKIVRERQWCDLPAARSGRVYCVRDEFLNTPAISLLRGLRALAWAIHPEVFPQTEGIRAINLSVL